MPSSDSANRRPKGGGFDGLLFFDFGVAGNDLTAFEETVRRHVVAQMHFAGQRILCQSFSG